MYSSFLPGVYLTNPLEIVPESVIMDQLTSDSVLLVRRHDIISRFRDWCPLNEILKQRDNRWRTMNVIGNVKLLKCTMNFMWLCQEINFYFKLYLKINVPPIFFFC